ncbi:aminotransferase class V [Pseudarthrobacter chlorophenolicus A6]|uniref:Kynureninase n=1 Tax=Pseudarthrobacter chlorophenolicus (strain ATCC 700700 / DSM 12829 / CIP 107037 / JCM 12360 / KCTC 9906 / NCIMB 13794 / A6) TaxID=452863 RepID=B8HG65_PSECP|nr:aminotransferase class V-fold PLP-dependent enzyme [Pseudarthrobacter chlorophenolicus]ACL39427.1 aminotransferase class V [Pseudarthrobacter chlorophenolicus A6]SDQ99488.1 Kynureninase [Pseudarthrobacter chlorophenolicus]
MSIHQQGAGPAAVPADEELRQRAADLDREDPLAHYRELFIGTDTPLSYLDGNSLGRPLKRTSADIAAFISDEWGGRLIRGWDEKWLNLPQATGDQLGRAVLGAAPGQTIIADSTTVVLYKLIRAALAAVHDPDRNELVLDTGNFPTDRYLVEGIALEEGLTLRWIETDPAAGVTVEQVRQATGPRTAVVLLSQIAYRSGHLADLPAITKAVHDAGALVVWDLCHSAGSVEIGLDSAGVDFAAGCTYKYLNGGPGSPAFAYVNARHLPSLNQPIWGWMGRKDAFEMAAGYEPAPGIRGFLSGTPAVFGMLAMRGTLDLIEEASMGAIRAKSEKLTAFAVEIFEALLAPLGAELASPRDPAERGSHITVDHADFTKATVEALWDGDVIPDFRSPSGLRVGLSPLSTSFAEVLHGMAAIRDRLAA